MAAAATGGGNSGIFWINGVSDEEQPLVFVPGVEGKAKNQTPFHLKPDGTSSKRSTKMRGRQSSHCNSETTVKKDGKKQGYLQNTQEKVPFHQSASVVPEHSFAPAAVAPYSSQLLPDTSRTQSLICLKDLCPEDKRRIANLIEELARVSEEKEESVQRLKDEQENFERKIQQLEQQNLIIAQERGSLQQQYRECHELLGLYQQYLSQQQAQLNQSIAQLSQEPAHSKVISGEEPASRTSTCRSNGTLFDGSYLSLAATRAQQPQVQRSGGGRRAAMQTLGNPASHPCVSEFCPTDGLNRSQRRCEHCHGRDEDSGHGTRQRRGDNGSCRENGHHNTFDTHEYKSGNAIDLEAKEVLSRPLLGSGDWEEKRHHLLLQKMQLEVERERLQARLAEQEERLKRQNQQLHQSRLDYSRFQQANQSDPSNSNTTNGDPQLRGPSQQELPSSLSSSVSGNAVGHPAGQILHEKHSQTQPAPQGNRSAEALERSRRDMATSPVKSPVNPSRPASVSVIQKTPEARLDFSVVELLDIFTPISAPELSKPSTQRPKAVQRGPALTAHKPVGRPLLTPARPYSQHAQQDLEESQILEDIFFIC